MEAYVNEKIEAEKRRWQEDALQKTVGGKQILEKVE